MQGLDSLQATMDKRWRFFPHDPDRIAALERAVGIPPVVAQLLIARGIVDPSQATTFLQPKLADLRLPEALPGCMEAAEYVYRALRHERRIVVYGDYDVDGMAGTALLYRCLKLLGGNVSYYIPHRIDEGYGVHEEAVRQLASQQAELLVTVDCGIGSAATAAVARQLGLAMVVTDHHQPQGQLPNVDALVHPALPNRPYPFPGLSGAGVAFKLAWGICQVANSGKKVSPAMRDFLVGAVGLAALGTVADVVPLLDENRILVHHGLASLKRQPSVGTAALAKVAGTADKGSLDAEDIAFSLAPRLNAAGRLGQAQLAVELLLTDREDRAQQLAEYLDGLNSTRQTLERKIYLAAHKQAKEQFDPANDPALVLAEAGWHPGVIGIVAGRLAEKYHRPVVIVSLDSTDARPAVGSARSVPGVNLHEALCACREHLVSFGGHAAAAGLTIEPSRIEAFRGDFCEQIAMQMTEAPAPEVRIDAEAPLGAFSLRVAEQIERMAPFGHGNPRPILCASGVRLHGAPRLMGSHEQHLAVEFVQDGVRLRAVAFGCGDWAKELARAQQPIDVVFRPVINTFRGQRRAEAHLVDWRPSRRPAESDD